MSDKLIEAAAEFLSRDTSTKQTVIYSVEESFLLSQEEFQSLSEEDQLDYINQLVELKKSTLASYMKKATKDIGKRSFRAGAMIGSRDDNKEALKDMDKASDRMKGIERAGSKMTGVKM
jgi:hypothetical protein